MGKIISLETKLKIKELLKTHSSSEAAALTGVSLRSIFKIQQEWNMERSPEQLKGIRSRIRKKIVQDERRRVIFGQDQKTQLKVFSNKKRHTLKYRLKRVGYKICDLPNTLLYDESTKRNPAYETMCKPLGLTILPA